MRRPEKSKVYASDDVNKQRKDSWLRLSFFFVLAQLLLVSHYRSAGFHFKNNWNPCQGWRLHNANKPDLNVHLVRSHRHIPQFNGITPSYTWEGKKRWAAMLVIIYYCFTFSSYRDAHCCHVRPVLSVASTPWRTFQALRCVVSRRPWLSPFSAAGFWLLSDHCAFFFLCKSVWHRHCSLT